jgi:HCOMODA/2-hydroxy-3-carboxy-muconic semialdehyde decarboxylase
MCVVHHHAPAFMPLVITGIDYVPVFHLGAAGGARPPFWDQREEFGDTNLLVVKPEEGASLAARLGPHWMVLMNRHGVTVAGTSVRDAVFRCVFSCLNARFQIEAAAAGKVGPLSPGEIKHAFGISTGTTGQARSWELWAAQLAKANGSPKAAPAKASKPRTIRKPAARR